MEPASAEQRELRRQVALARPVFAVLAIVDLIEARGAPLADAALVFLAVYAFFAVAAAVLEALGRWKSFQMPMTLDVFVLAVFLVLTPSVVAFWFLYLFVVFAAGMRWGGRPAVTLAALVSVALLVRASFRSLGHWPSFAPWVGVLGTLVAGIGIGYLGARQRRHASEHEFLSDLALLLRVEQGLAESVRHILEELCRAFQTELAFLVFHDRELERLFLWKFRSGQRERLTPEILPDVKADAFLLDAPEANVCWNSFEGAGEGFAWNRRDAQPLREVPRLPGPSRRELGLRSLLAVTFDFGGRPAGRMLLGNAQRAFTRDDLRWLEKILRHVAPPLENLFLLRTLRAQAIETERGRIAHDIHDGILQTLLSVQMQLDMLGHKVLRAPEAIAADLAALQETLLKETSELRRMVSGMRTLHVESADLADLMQGFAERFRTESGLEIDLFVDGANLQMTPRLCREVFQIYREALYNVKKHANATHVVVKLWQEEDRAYLMVDDNGKGFSFAGRFSSEELDRLRLGPISIKERTRGVGGVLTVESSPGHGVRLLVELPAS